jgi:dephospho-CoA kinase
MSLVVGLTGNIGSGKTTVSQRLAALGATVIDADQMAREAVQAGTPALRRIAERWGVGVLAADGLLDRAALRRRVFHDPTELEELNEIVHPAVTQLREENVAAARARGDHVVVCDLPLLFERRLADEFDRIVLVDAPRPLRLERLVRERGLPETEAVDMIAAQMPAELKRARADYVIDNAGSLADLDVRVAELWTALAREARELTPSLTA